MFRISQWDAVRVSRSRSASFEAGIGFSGGLLYNNCEKKKAKRQEIG